MPIQPTQQPPYYQRVTNQIDITDAQIKLLHTTEITLIPAPGTGKIIIPTSLTIWWTNYVANYTNISANAILVLYTSELKLQQPSQAISNNLNGILAPGFASISYIFPSATVSSPSLFPKTGNPIADEENKPLKMYLENAAGALTGGNAANTLRAQATYFTITL